MGLTLRESISRAQRLPRNDEVLMGRARLLAAEDRDLIEAVLVKGQSTMLVGRMTGQKPRAVRNRVYRLGRRLTSRKFLDAARAIAYLDREDASLARMAFCEGATQREMAGKLGLTSHTLRRRLDRVGAQVAAIRRLSTSRELRKGA